MRKIYLSFITFIWGSGFALFGQLEVLTSYSVDDIVKRILVNSGENFDIKNISYQGSKRSLGVFKCDMKYNSFIKKGIIMSTGYVIDAAGPNYLTNKSSDTYINNDPDLETLTKGKTFDAATLEFDFIASGDSISFNFFFASEEYPEYVNKNVNDLFGFFLTDKESGEKTNLAVLPQSDVPITVDNINANKNNEYFIENLPWDSRTSSEWTEQKATAEIAFTFEFDGLTKLIHVSSPTKKGNVYHLKLSIADVGDRMYDSAIFIEANSFTNHNADPVNALDNVKKVFSRAEKTSDSILVSLNIQFAADSSRINDAESIKLLDKVFELMSSNSGLKLQVSGHTDDTGTPEHNLQLSEERAMNVTNYLRQKGIDPERIIFKGFGSRRPISRSDKSLNRRVEFVFKAQ